MGWYTTAELDKFLTATGGYLREHAAENFTLLSAAQDALGAPTGPTGATGAAGPTGAGRPARAAGPARTSLYGWWAPQDGIEPRGAFLHDASGRLIIAGRAPEPAAALAATLARAGRTGLAVSAVDAPSAAADAFAAAWSQRSGMAVRVIRNSQLFRLTSVIRGYEGPAGRARPATWADRGLLVAWLSAMGTEVGNLGGAPEASTDDLLGYGGAVLWEADDAPVSMAVVTRPVAGVVRVANVYTPPAYRGRGYGSAVMVAVCRAALVGRAREVIVLADQLRPLRRATQLGFEPAGERSVLSFGPPTGPLPVQRPSGPMPRIR
ncbi:MAG TPA: GNAT family N-acetyltransferase [Trebonia sp.]|nr:GNAT family N-acetyltransferase [Trebonia sp.]